MAPDSGIHNENLKDDPNASHYVVKASDFEFSFEEIIPNYLSH